jgi:hypothetical protein
MKNVIIRRAAPHGEFHDQGDAKWIVISGPLWGQQYALQEANPRLAYQPPRDWPLSGRIWWFQLLIIINSIFQHCPPDHGIDLTGNRRYEWVR